MKDERDPSRLESDGGETPPSLQRALRSAARHEPTDTQLRALEVGLGPLLGLPHPGGGGSAPGSGGDPAGGAPHASPSPPMATGMGPLVKGVALASVLGAVVATALWIRRPAPRTDDSIGPTATTSTSAVMSADVIASVEAPTPPVQAAPSTSVDAPPSGSVPLEHGTRVPSPPVTASASAGTTEVALLQKARKALDHDPATALALTAEHRRLFPKGALAQERDVIAIEALARLGRANEAKVQSDQFHQQYPSSIHQRDVEPPPR